MWVVFVVDNYQVNFSSRLFHYKVTRLDAAKHAIDLFIRLMHKRKQLDRSSITNTNNINTNTFASTSANAIQSIHYSLFATGHDGFHVANSQAFPEQSDFMARLNALSPESSPLSSSSSSSERLKQCMSSVFEFLHCLHFSTFDTFGFGRYLPLHDPVAIILFTSKGYMTDLTFPHLDQCPGANFYAEPFRWNQRLVSVLLEDEFANDDDDHDEENKLSESSISSEFWLKQLCQVTGGCLEKARNLGQLRSVIQRLVGLSGDEQVDQPNSNSLLFPTGIYLRFDISQISDLLGVEDAELNNELVSVLADSPDLRQLERMKPGFVNDLKTGSGWISQLSDISRFVGYLPIPENFYAQIQQIPLTADQLFRPCHPRIYVCKSEGVTAAGIDWSTRIPDGMMLKKYLIDPQSKLAALIARHPKTSFALTTQLPESGGVPFGFVRQSSQGSGINFYVLPYDFPVLFQLVDTWKRQKGRVDADWSKLHSKYFQSLPQYYYSAIHKALTELRLPKPIPLPEGLEKGTAEVMKIWQEEHCRLRNECKMRLEKLHNFITSAGNEYNALPADVLQENLEDQMNVIEEVQLCKNAFDLSRVNLEKEYYNRLKQLYKVKPRNMASVPFIDFNLLKPITSNSLSSSSSSSDDDVKTTVKSTAEPNPKTGTATLTKRPVLGPRHQVQEQMDAKFTIPIAEMQNYHPRQSARLRFVNEDDERRDKMLAFGNPYKRLGDVSLGGEDVPVNLPPRRRNTLSSIKNSNSWNSAAVRKTIEKRVSSQFKIFPELAHLEFSTQSISAGLLAEYEKKYWDRVKQVVAFEETTVAMDEVGEDELLGHHARRKKKQSLGSASKGFISIDGVDDVVDSLPQWVDETVNQSSLVSNRDFGSSTPVVASSVADIINFTTATETANDRSERGISSNEFKGQNEIEQPPSKKLKKTDSFKGRHDEEALVEVHMKQLAPLVRKPGRLSQNELLSKLESITAESSEKSIKSKLVNSLIVEAQKYKKKDLICALQKLL